VWALIAIFVIMVVALLLFIVWLMWVVGGRMIRPLAERHDLLQEIAETGQPPAAWLLPYRQRLAKLANDPNKVEKAGAIRQQAKVTCLHRLDALIKYLHDTNLIESESTRSSLLGALYQARAGWLATADADFV
jgi:hypothetical protein